MGNKQFLPSENGSPLLVKYLLSCYNNGDPQKFSLTVLALRVFQSEKGYLFFLFQKLPYDLTYKWNLMNKTSKQTKQNQRHRNKEQTDSDKRGGGVDKGGKKGKGKGKEHEQRIHVCGQHRGFTVGAGGDGAGKSNEKKGRTMVTEQQYLKTKRKLHQEITSCI